MAKALVGAAMVALLVQGAWSGVGAQEGWTVSVDDDCESRGRRARVCEVRERTFPAPAGLEIDGGTNGGASVTGADRADIRVRARVQANARGEERAEELVRAVQLRMEGGTLVAEGPDSEDRESWAVSWEVEVPRSTDLRIETRNGGISVAEVSGRIELSAQNGGLRLSSLAGDVRGRTLNGGVTVTLAGTRWEGTGLDVVTTNGSVRLDVPRDYSAELETGTVNGGVDLDFPITVQGRLGRRIRATLGDGGPPIRVTTTNGGVRVMQP